MYSGLLTDQSIALNRRIDDDIEDVLVKVRVFNHVEK
jgi:hypothetical protein